jgi:hypothetical protein
LAAISVAMAASVMSGRPRPVRFHVDCVDWFERLPTVGRGSYGEVKVLDEHLVDKYNLVGQTVVKRVHLLQRLNSKHVLSETLVCEIVSLFALEGVAREQVDVIAPVLKTIVFDPVTCEVYLMMTRMNKTLSDCIEDGSIARMDLDNVATSLSFLVA